MSSEELARQKFWDELRTTTQARIGLGRAGNGLPTREVLALNAAHAAARDAVHLPLDVAALAAAVAEVGIGTPATVTSRATSRGEYLRRPDLGRSPADLSTVPAAPADIGFVLADGLSPTALMHHGAALLRALVAQLGQTYSLAPPVIATQARVALGDHIAARGGYGTLLVIVGERPGLSVADSLGIYLT
ncbi:MAG: ethanolamine ammonia-lyase light chain EutC, partial [Mycobacterium sp.]